MYIDFDAKNYSNQEFLRLQEIFLLLGKPGDDILHIIETDLSRPGSRPFCYMLLLLATECCCRLLRFDDADNFLRRADMLCAPGEVEPVQECLIRAHLARGKKLYGEAFRLLASQLAREDISMPERATLLLDLAVVHRGTGNIKEALQTAIEHSTLWKKLGGHKAGQARAEHNIGNLYGELGKWEESLFHIEAALELYRQVDDINGQARGHNGIAVYFFMSSAYEVAIESYAASERLYVSVGNELRALSVRGNIAFCYHELGRNEEAVTLMKEVAEGYRALGDFHNYARATISLALILLDVDIPAAEEMALDEELVPHLDIIMRGARSLVLAGAASNRGEYGTAVELALQTLEMCEKTGYDQYKLRTLELIAHALKQQGDSDGAYDYQVRAYNYARDQHRRKLEAQHRALTLKLQRERIEHERVLLQAEIQQKQKELTATTLKLVERSKLMGVITQRLRDLHTGVSDRNKHLVNETLALIESQSGNVWEAFEQSLDGLTNRFFRVLAERHTNLSPAEQRIAGLLRAGMSTKEIAASMHISTRTVETHRYRLRKKLLSADAHDLIGYLQQLGSSDDE
jgi:DNA-binding CsgD family transcriptional regulator